MQQQKLQAAEKQPFFKPIQQQTMSSTSVRQQNEQMSKERLGGLHAKLHQEAEKIRKWKCQTESEIRHKDRIIQEVREKIACQNSVVMQLKLENENLNLTVENEMANRKELSEKIGNDMSRIVAVKGLAEKLCVHVKETEEVSDDITQTVRESSLQLEELAGYFTILRKSATVKHNETMKKCAEERCAFDEKEKTYQAKLAHMEEEGKELSRHNRDKDELVQSISDQLNEGKQEYIALQSVYKESQSGLKELESVTKNIQVDLNNTQEELTEIRAWKDKLEKQLSETAKCLDETTRLKEESIYKIEELNTELIELKVKNEQVSKALQESLQCGEERESQLTSELNECKSLLEEMKTSKEMAVLERKHIENRCERLEIEKTTLEEKYEEATSQAKSKGLSVQEKENQIAELNTIHSAQQEAIQKLEDLQSLNKNQLKEMQEQLLEIENLNKSLEDINEGLQTELSDAIRREEDTSVTVEELKSRLSTESNEQGDLIEKMEKLKIERSSIQKELTGNKKEASKISKELEKYKKVEAKLKQQVKDNASQILELKEEVQIATDKLHKYEVDTEKKFEKEMSNASSLTIKLDETEKKLADFESKVKQSKSDMSSKSKLIKDLEKEVKTLKNQVDSKTKECEKLGEECSAVETNLEDGAKEIADVKADIKAAKTTITNLEKKLNQKSKEVDKAKDLETKIRKEKENGAKCYDDQLNVMVAMLDQYKKENQKTVELKNKELTELKVKLNAATQRSFSLEKKEKELEQCKSANESAMQDKEEYIKSLDKEKEKISLLQSQLSEKDEDAKKLVSELEKLRIESSKHSELEKEMQILAKSEKSWKDNFENVQKDLSTAENRCKDLVAELKNSKAVTTDNTAENVSELGGGDAVTRIRKTAPETPNINGNHTPVNKKNTLTQSKSRENSPLHTPRPTAMTVLSAKTPSRSILLKSKLKNKRRKVAFASDDEEKNDNSDSSSSELMVVEIEELENHLKSRPKTPLLQGKPSTRIRLTKSPGFGSPSYMTPTCRDAVQPKKSKKSNVQDTQEMKKFAELYPNDDPSRKDNKPNNKKPQTKSMFRKTPSKGPGKFFKSSPMDKRQKVAERTHQKSEDLAWFEADAVFGFGSED